MILVLGLSFLGGLVLNLMPCCLPVLSLKILKIVNLAQNDPKKILTHGLYYSAGIIGSFIALGLLSIAISGFFFGIQLTSPLFCVITGLVMTFLGLSAMGILPWLDRLTLGKQIMSTGKYITGFFQGLLATALGAACVGPFLGSALVLTSILSWPLILTSFAMMGLGMAAPILLLCAFPKALRWIPKPGPWMVWLKKGMGGIMLLTAVWLFALAI